MENRKCNRCGEKYPLTKEFWGKCKTCFSRLNTICKICKKKDRKEYEKNIENKNKIRNSNKKRYEKRALDGNCLSCGRCISDREINQSRYCSDCWFKQNSKSNLKNRKLWNKLKQKFIEQEGKCFYSGRKLILGINCSIDHILPKSKYKEKYNDINNIRFVDFNVNISKADMSEKDFLNMIEDIYHYLISKNLYNHMIE